MEQRRRVKEPQVLLHPRAAEALVLAARRERQDEIVAVVLADGSVRELRERPEQVAARRRWASGSLAGRDWVIWWERRRLGTVAS